MKKAKLSLKQLETIVSEEIRRGKQPDVLIGELTKRGWPEAAARHFVNNSRRMQAVTRQVTLLQAEQANNDSEVDLPLAATQSLLLWILAVAGLMAVLMHILA